MKLHRLIAWCGLALLVASLLVTSPVGARETAAEARAKVQRLQKAMADVHAAFAFVSKSAKGNPTLGKEVARLLDEHAHAVLAAADAVRPFKRRTGVFATLLRRTRYDHGASIKIQRDKDGSCHAMLEMELAPDAALALTFVAYWESPVPRGDPSTVLVGLARLSEKARYAEVREVELEIGGKKIRPKADRNVSAIGEEVFEQIDIELDDAGIAALVTASKPVHGRIRSDRFQISTAQISALHDIMTRGLKWQ